jgi:hypothetical protein
MQNIDTVPRSLLVDLWLTRSCLSGPVPRGEQEASRRVTAEKVHTVPPPDGPADLLPDK